ncbi:MAG: hypothetical protein JWQ87_5275 [Candidatus Sulfotelmatobacter sp.]|nr:hypothetical protein [Candidatus Sulfotelmatobacter sp.]
MGIQLEAFIVRNLKSVVRVILTLLLTGAFFPRLVCAQTASTTPSLDLQTGVSQYGSYHGGNIDTIDLSNGHLMVDIPLISYPQRGGHLKLGWVLHYTNTGIYTPGSFPTLTGCCIVFPFDSGFEPEEIGLPGFSAGCQVQTWSLGSPAGSSGGGFDQCSASAFAPDGAAHPMVPIARGTFMAEDASGYRIDVPEFTLPPSNTQHPGDQTAYLTGPDGVRYSHSSVTYPIISEDTNGNQITLSGGGWTDTIGRFIPAFPPFLTKLQGPFPTGVEGSTTDYSGCTGPLPVAGAIVWDPPGVDGGSYHLKFCFALISEIIPAGETTAGDVSFPVPPEPTTAIQLQSVVLPNGTAWTLQYTTDGMADLQRVVLPTGGTISYTWTTPDTPFITGLDAGRNILPRAVATRIVDAADGSSPAGLWTYKYDRTLTNGALVTTATDPSGNDTVHSFGLLNVQGSLAAYETKTEHYQGSSVNGAMLRRDQTEYQQLISFVGLVVGQNPVAYTTVVPIRTITTLDNGLQTKSEMDYDRGFTSTTSGSYDFNGNALPLCSGCRINGLYGQVTATRHYDYGQGAPGPLLKAISTPHLAFDSAPYLANNLLDLVSSEVIKDGAGTAVASTTYGYDEAPPLSSSITTQHDGNPPAGVFRGNNTSVQHLVVTPATACGTPAPSNTTITSSMAWFDTGEVAKSIDPLGNATTYSYAASLGGAYPTSICNALNQCGAVGYDFNTGLITSSTDLNDQMTQYAYDGMGRVNQILYPPQTVAGSAINGTTTLTYTDTPGSLSVQRTRQQDAGSSVIDFKFFDGLGRTSGTELVDPEGNIFTKTTYDGLGQIASVTNPYRTTSDPTYGVTKTSYDGLGRVTQVTHPDGSSILNAYSGRAAEIQDEGNGSSRGTRITQLDALGRLASVCEVTTTAQANQNTPSACGQDIQGTGFFTNYQYDTLSNLIAVQQGGVNRSFTYDSLSRLVDAYNPESGNTCYQYDAAGNVRQRLRPSPNQSDESVMLMTSYQYDALNRLTNTSYSDSATPAITRHYDTTSELGVPLNNTVGRLSAEYVTSPSGQILSGRVYSYDSLGHIIDNSQCTPQNCSHSVAFPFQYSYDLLGKPTGAGLGQGTVLSYAYNGSGNLISATSSLSDSNHPAMLLSSALYNSFGQLSAVTLGNALNESFIQNNRGWITSYNSSIAQPQTANMNVGTSLELHDSLLRNVRLNGEFLNRNALWNLKSSGSKNAGRTGLLRQLRSSVESRTAVSLR